MFKFIKAIFKKNSEVSPSVGDIEGSDIYLTTKSRNYTKSEFMAYMDKLHAITESASTPDITIYDERTTKDLYDRYYHSKSNYIVGEINLSKICYLLRDLSGGMASSIKIDLYRESFDYYITLIESIIDFSEKIKYGYGKSIHFITRDLRCSLRITSDISYRRHKLFNGISNFLNENSFKEYKHETEGGIPYNHADVWLDRYNSDEMATLITKLPEFKENYINYHFVTIRDEIEHTVSQFPEYFYEISISHANGDETMYALTVPTQEETASYRVDNILFRDGNFCLIPSVLFRINVSKKTKIDLIKSAINLCDSNVVRQMLYKNFGI